MPLNENTQDMDVDAGTIQSAGVSVADNDRENYELFLRDALDEASKSEAQGLRDNEVVTCHIGAVM